MSHEVTVTVVVATHDRPGHLQRCLLALAEQTRRPDAVVVVDDAPGTPARVDPGLAARLNLRLLRMPASGGPARARNHGLRDLDSAFVAFTDDDCRPAPGWLAALLDAAAEDAVVVGRTTPDPDDGPLQSVFDRTMQAEGPVGRFSTCNVLYPRALLARLGGFDETFRRPFGEDTDLGQRALAAGAHEVYADAAVVRHAVHRPGMRAALEERWRAGEVVAVARRHPALRREAWGGWYWKASHPPLLGLLAGAAMSPLSPVFLLAAGPWYESARYRIDHDLGLPRRAGLGRVAQFGGLLALDAVEVASCAVASLRERTLFL